MLASNGIISRIIDGVINEIITEARYNAVARTSLWMHYDIAWTMGDDLADPVDDEGVFRQQGSDIKAAL